jgi:hypothetical protein
MDSSDARMPLRANLNSPRAERRTAQAANVPLPLCVRIVDIRAKRQVDVDEIEDP